MIASGNHRFAEGTAQAVSMYVAVGHYQKSADVELDFRGGKVMICVNIVILRLPAS